MATAADRVVQVHKTPPLAILFMVGLCVALLACVAAMLPFLTGITHGFAWPLVLPFVFLFIFCAIVLYWGVKADPKFLTGAKVLLILTIIGSLGFTNVLDWPVLIGIVISALYLVYFFRSQRLRAWYRSMEHPAAIDRKRGAGNET
jgi:hypothetical protein